MSGEQMDKTSATGLKPCPFCGSVSLKLIMVGDKNMPLMILCECGASGPQAATEAELRALWEMRAVEA